MNIFVLHENQQVCAKFHVDSHVVKMVTEYAQMLSTSCRLCGLDAGYKITHINHPCNLWVRESVDNWLWLRRLAFSLNREWQYRYGHVRNHAAYDVIRGLPIPPLPQIGLTKFVQAMPDLYKHDNAILAYRAYYTFDKEHLHKWTKRRRPIWCRP